jgi:CreA protein
VSTAIIASSLLASSLPTLAMESQIVGQISGSGLVFKDTLEVERFDDPKIKGITLYITNFQRPITERLTSNFLQDPSYASVACVKTSPTVSVADNINTTPQGEQVFQESKSLLFKTLRGKTTAYLSMMQ